MFKYYKRLCKIECDTDCKNSLLRSAFIEDKSFKQYWSKSIIALQKKFNLPTLEISETQFMTDIKKYYTNKLTNCLKNIEVNKTGKLYFYITIFGKFELQKYLEFPLAEELRSLLTKVSISAHSLAIETNRLNNTLKQQRFCKHCPTSVENESHFILYCSRFDNLRLTSDYKEIFPTSRVDADLIKDILNPSYINNAKLICRFLKEAHAIRNEDINTG
jgi:hypothetical protein